MIEEKQYSELCEDVLPVFRRMSATDRYAITLGGSHGKGLSDRQSDFDFRIYFETPAKEPVFHAAAEELGRAIEKWKARDIEIDGVWPRAIADVDRELDRWLAGDASPKPYEWNVWGYHMLTDIYNQAIVEDPCGVAQAWKDRLAVYPDTLRDSILKHRGDSLRYWLADYHYRNKAVRRDFVFMASITARLVNDMMQILYALNRFYFPGDGLNLIFSREFSVKPDNLEERIVRILYPGADAGCLDRQYSETTALIIDVLALASCSA